jgi:hypothetical protein
MLLTHEQRLQKHLLIAVGTTPTPVFPINLASATSGAPDFPQAHLASLPFLALLHFKMLISWHNSVFFFLSWFLAWKIKFYLF